jgi:hypothetical protein
VYANPTDSRFLDGLIPRLVETVDGFVPDFLGNPFANQITSADIERYKRQRRWDRVTRTDWETGGRYEQEIGPRPVNQELKALRNMFALAIRPWKYLRGDPALDVALVFEPETEKRVLEGWEEERLLPLLPEHLRPLVLFLPAGRGFVCGPGRAGRQGFATTGATITCAERMSIVYNNIHRSAPPSSSLGSPRIVGNTDPQHASEVTNVLY